ncbi:lysophospholipid acyltransferase family protein [Varunaivibrio sulfuroxidans]|uniref:Lyso-ornithine lipid acyltransferase n=1 Tax=Varunaivibrio sulfuroxidans TaxID=1773489 RepID=A0A4R3JEB0_9PROT|nr:lysophospholipid acyltransferase family protein [Varunaivibrio sulfuroxidans]TCS63543.1 lyso-ornithine lipid acyltransferase [Varunaivibrio sulfuroxidans]WES30312.1 lysophospholipid acyltransferase family protein [Varunaivibrio sulfuroxidans]
MKTQTALRLLAIVRMTARAGAFVALTVLLVPPYLLVYPLGRLGRDGIARLYFRGCVALTGLRLRVSGATNAGAANRDGPVLFVANHVSYLDIPVLGALCRGTFIAKGEVSRWPVFGPLARLSGTVFVSRINATLNDERNILAERLNAGENFFLFPEGTSSDGSLVGPFKSALFSPAHMRNTLALRVQPVTIAYATDRKGRRLGPVERDRYAWYGDMEMFGHLLRVFMLPGAIVDVRFHRAVAAHDFADRKTLAQHSHDAVSRGLSDILGRPRDGAAADRATLYDAAAE